MTHEVSFRIPNKELGKADLEFQVSGMIGRLKVSKGSVVWFPRDRSDVCNVSWKPFDPLM